MRSQQLQQKHKLGAHQQHAAAATAAVAAAQGTGAVAGVNAALVTNATPPFFSMSEMLLDLQGEAQEEAEAQGEVQGEVQGGAPGDRMAL